MVLFVPLQSVGCKPFAAGVQLPICDPRSRARQAVCRTPIARQADAEGQAEGVRGPFDLSKAVSGLTRKLKAGSAAVADEVQPDQRSGTRRLKARPKAGTARAALSFGGTIGKQLGTIRLGPSGKTDLQTVFVAGANGRLGARIVRELLQQGLKVRAGVRDPQKARGFLQTALEYGLIAPDAARRLTLVPVDLTDVDSIMPAIGNAGKVVSAIGAPEDDLLAAFKNVKKIDGEGAIALVQAAEAAGVQHFVMVSSLGTGKFGWPAGALNAFGGVLIWKRRAEEALEASRLIYTIVRPGGMERPQDDYKVTHNVALSPRDTLFGGQVSRLQVAELIATAVRKTEVAENKVLEVVAETEKPDRSYEELLEEMPSEYPQAERIAAAQAADAAVQQLEAAREKGEAAKADAAAAKERLGESNQRLAELRAQEREVSAEVSDILKEAESAQRQLNQLEAEADQAARLDSAAKATLREAQRAAREGRSLTAAELSSIRTPILNPPTAEELEAERKAAEQARREQQERQKAEAAARSEAAAAQARATKEAEAKAKEEAKERARQAAAKEKEEVAAKAAKATANARAQKEADEKRQAEKLQEEEEEEAAKAEAAQKAKAEKKAQARAQQEKEEQETKRKAEVEAKAKAEAEQQQKEEEEARVAAAEEEKERKAQVSTATADTARAETQAAERGSEEARAWIQNWRTGNVSYRGSAPATSSFVNPLANFKWPWQQNGTGEKPSTEPSVAPAAEPASAPDASAAAQSVSEGAHEAREWINAWRQRTLESTLQKDANANVEA